MSIRKATPEETEAFWGKPAVVFGQKKPDSQKAPQTTDSADEEGRQNMLKKLKLTSAKWNHQVALDGEQEQPTDPKGED